MINASSMSMGFLRSLYFEQVKKSVADAKEKEAKEQEKEAQEKANMSPGYDRANQRLRQESIKRYNNRMRQQQTQKQSRVDLPSMSNEDLEDALEELE